MQNRRVVDPHAETHSAANEGTAARPGHYPVRDSSRNWELSLKRPAIWPIVTTTSAAATMLCRRSTASSPSRKARWSSMPTVPSPIDALQGIEACRCNLHCRLQRQPQSRLNGRNCNPLRWRLAHIRRPQWYTCRHTGVATFGRTTAAETADRCTAQGRQQRCTPYTGRSHWDTGRRRFRRLAARTAVAVAADRCTAQGMEEWCTPYIGRSLLDTDRRTDRQPVSQPSPTTTNLSRHGRA